MNYFHCVLCSKRTKPAERRSINKGIKKYLRRKFLIEAPDNSVMCNKCRHIYRNESATGIYTCNQSDTCTVSTSDQQKSPPSVSLSLASTAKTHAYCCICKKPGPKLVVIPTESRTAVFVERNVLIPPGNRCCPVHFDNGAISSDAIQQIPTTENAFINRTTITLVMSEK